MNNVKEMDPLMSICLEKANYYVVYKPELVKRMFLKIPAKWRLITADDKSLLVDIASMNYPKDIYDLLGTMRARKSEDYASLRDHVKQLIAKNLYNEVYVKKIPIDIFEQGAMSFGACENIAYMGKYFLKVCKHIGAANNIPHIDFRKINVKYELMDLDDVIASQDELRKKAYTFVPKSDKTKEEPKKSCVIYTPNILGMPESCQYKFLIVDLNKMNLPIIGAVATYEDITVDWSLDFSTINKGTQHLTRPVEMAYIKVLKQLFKVYYSQLILGDEGILDDDDLDYAGELQLEQSDTNILASSYDEVPADFKNDPILQKRLMAEQKFNSLKNNQESNYQESSYINDVLDEIS